MKTISAITGANGLNISALLQLNANDYVSTFAFQSSGPGLTLIGSSATSMSLTKVN